MLLVSASCRSNMLRNIGSVFAFSGLTNGLLSYVAPLISYVTPLLHACGGQASPYLCKG